MAQQGSIKWESETGSITLVINGNEERIFIISRDFIEEFKKELINTSGEPTFRMTMRKLNEKLGKASAQDAGAIWEDFEKFNDEQILPVSPAGIPQEYSWDGKTRDILLLPDIKMTIWTVKSIQAFKEVLMDIMTEKGANAVINGAGKKAGMAIGARFAKYFGWSGLQNALDTLNDTAQKMNAVAGWGKGSVVTQKGNDGKEMIVLKIQNSYEAHGKKSSIPFCTITSSLLNGIWHTFADILDGLAAEAREVKCKAKGDDCCTFAIKIKDKDAPPLDWKDLAGEWQAIAG